LSNLQQKEYSKPGANAAKSAPGFLRRSAAMLYDFLLLLAILFVATALLLPFNSGKAFSSGQIAYPIYLLLVSFLFYGWFWTHGGQTLGLRTWKLRVATLDNRSITWQRAMLRFLAALISWMTFGLGFFWLLIDRKKRAWHDHLSKTGIFFDDQYR